MNNPASRLGSVCCILVALSAGILDAAGAETIELRVADTLPSSHYLVEYATKPFIEAVERHSQGTVKINYLGGGQLGKLNDMISLINGGVADIGYVAPSAATEKMPLSGVAELPGTFATSCSGTKAFYRLSTEGILRDNDYAKTGLRLLFNVVLPPYQVFADKPISAIADIKGLKLRAAGSAQIILAKSLGAVPVSVAATEQFEALARGTLDGSIYPSASVISYELDKHLKSGTTKHNFGSGVVTYVISEKRLAELPELARNALIEAGREITASACEKLDADVGRYEKELRAKGIELVEFSGADKTVLDEAVEEAQQGWISTLSELGFPAEETLEEFKAELDSN